MKIFVALPMQTLLILSVVTAYAQIDSLKNVIASDGNDTTKIKALNLLGWQVMYDDPDTAVVLGRQALALARRQSNPRHMANTFSNLGVYYDLMGEYDTALHYHFRALAIREAENILNGVAVSCNNIGIILMSRSDYPQARRYLVRAFGIHEKLGNRHDAASCLNAIGNLHLMQSDYVQALDNHFKALKIREELNDREGMSSSFSNIGVVYKRQHDYDKALEYYNKALQLDLGLGHRWNVAGAYTNIAAIYRIQLQYGKALRYLYKAKSTREQLALKESLAVTYNNIGAVFRSAYDESAAVRADIGEWALANPAELLDSALYYSQKAYEINLYLGSDESMTYNLTNIGGIYHALGQFDRAVSFFEKAIVLADSIGSLQRAYEAHKGMADAYKKWSASVQDDEVKASYLLRSIYHLDLYAVLRDEIYGEEKQKDIGRLEARHEHEMEDLKRAQEEQEQARIMAEVTQRRNNLQYSASLLAICLLFAGLFFMGKLTLPQWAMELSVFVPVLILFEFLLVLSDPYVDGLTGGEPAFALLINASFAGLIFPVHNFFEGLIRRRLFRKAAKAQPEMTTLSDVQP